MRFRSHLGSSDFTHDQIEREAARRGVTTGFLRAEKAQQIRQEILGPAAHLKRAISKEMLVKMGVYFWPLTFGKDPTYEGAVRAVIAEAERLSDLPHKDRATLLATWNVIEALEVPDVHMQFFGGCRWVDQGLPTIVLGARYAAALMSTSVTSDVLDVVRAPWKAFLIEIPPVGLILHGEADEQDEIRRILVWCEPASENIPEAGWGYFTMCDEAPMTLWCINSLPQMLEHDASTATSQWDALPFGIAQDDRDQRIRTMIHRLILNTCLAMSDPANLTAVGNVHKQPWNGPSERWLREPVLRHYRLGAPVMVDCREDVRDYVEGTRKTWELGVQIKVRGYWKMQHYGPKASLRKPIWIAPYKKGKDDAPVLIRPHHLQDPES
jgi:hypothetical protein